MTTKFKTLSFSICLPVYKGSSVLKHALDSIFRQKFPHLLEIIIGEDTPLQFIPEITATKKLIKSYPPSQRSKIKFIKNKTNLGYPLNLKKIAALAKGDVIFLMAQDDILAKNSLQKTHDAFFLGSDVGCVTRPYFWFYQNFHHPVRTVTPYDPTQDTILTINEKSQFLKVFESIGQLSGLAYRRRYLKTPFNQEVFPAHIYPFADIFKHHQCVFLKDYTLAVGIVDSQTRHVSSIYNQSPILSWLKMYRIIFSGKKYSTQREWGRESALTNYLGLIQLKNYAQPGVLWREIKILAHHRPKNLLTPKFYFYALITLFTPRFILRKLTDWYKIHLLAPRLPKIKFSY